MGLCSNVSTSRCYNGFVVIVPFPGPAHMRMKAGCSTLTSWCIVTVSVLSLFVTVLRVGWSAVCECGISCSYSLAILFMSIHFKMPTSVGI